MEEEKPVEKPVEKKVEEKKLDRWQKIGVMMLIFIFAGMTGWIWEFILAEIKDGWKGAYVIGGNILPWLNIYAYGAILFYFTVYRLRKRPWLVFLVGGLLAGLFEWFCGWLVYTVGDGTRYWNYMNEWYGGGSINGFVCPASVCAFGFGAMLFTYTLFPFVNRLALRMSKKAFMTFAVTMFVVFMADDITNLTLKNLNMPTAQDFYMSLGWIRL